MFGHGAPADRKNVSGVEGAPVIEGASPAVEHDEYLLTSDLTDCGWTDEVRVLPVHRL